METILVAIIFSIVVLLTVIKEYKKNKVNSKNRSQYSVNKSAVKPFSKKTELVSSKSINKKSSVSIKSNKSTNLYNKSNLLQEGVSSLRGHTPDIRLETDSQNASFDLDLNTTEDYQRAFIHSLIFERKY